MGSLWEDASGSQLDFVESQLANTQVDFSFLDFTHTQPAEDDWAAQGVPPSQVRAVGFLAPAACVPAMQHRCRSTVRVPDRPGLGLASRRRRRCRPPAHSSALPLSSSPRCTGAHLPAHPGRRGAWPGCRAEPAGVPGGGGGRGGRRGAAGGAARVGLRVSGGAGRLGCEWHWEARLWNALPGVT